MAPTPSRRVGSSRPAQFLLFVSYVVAALGAVGGLILLVTAWADPAGHAQLRARFTDLTAPMSAGGAAVVRGGKAATNALSDYWLAGAQNQGLRQELEDGRIGLVEAAAISAENARLKRLLRVIERDGPPIAVTRLVASSPGALRRLVVLPVGRSAGVRPTQPVRGPAGLIGRVIEVGAISARVLLLTDSASIVPVRRASDDMAAVAAGDGAGALEIRPLASRRVQLRPGDLFVTSGVGGIFPPGIPVAVVRQGGGQRVIARPLANPELSDHVMILPIYAPEVASSAPPSTPPLPAAAGSPDTP